MTITRAFRHDLMHEYGKWQKLSTGEEIYVGDDDIVGKGAARYVGKTLAEAQKIADAETAAKNELNEWEAMEAVRDGRLPSPTKYGEFWLFDIRITGTGAAFRDKLGEWAIRDPDIWTSDAFVKRCAGLPVIFEHPKSSTLNAQEYADRNIGTVRLPYIKDKEVWGVAQIFDPDAAELMQRTHISTSPGVVPPKEAVPIPLKDGGQVLDEPLPKVLDHIAVCEAGVWDKDGPPEGIRLDSQLRKDQVHVGDEDIDKIKKERDDAVAHLDALRKRVDSLEKSMKKDADEDEGEDAAEVQAGDKDDAKVKVKKDADEDPEDSDGDDDEDDEPDEPVKEDKKSKKDADMSMMDKKAKKDRKDATAPEEPIDANEGTKIYAKHDSSAKLLRELNELRTRMAVLERPPSIEDRDLLAKAFHKADSIFQMHAAETPQHMAGESPIAYRRRLCNGLKKYSKSWKDYALHDSIDDRAFDLIEKQVYAEAMESATDAVADQPGVLREVKGMEMGKHVSRFYGDARAAWLPFMPPQRQFLRKIDTGIGRAS